MSGAVTQREQPRGGEAGRLRALLGRLARRLLGQGEQLAELAGRVGDLEDRLAELEERLEVGD